MSQRTTDVQIFDELAQEAGELSEDLENKSGRIVAPDLIALGIAKLTTLMRQPPEAYQKLSGACHLTEIDEAIKRELFVGQEWNHDIRRAFFAKQIATIQSMNNDDRDSDALIELDRFLRMVIIGIETYRAHALRH